MRVGGHRGFDRLYIHETMNSTDSKHSQQNLKRKNLLRNNFKVKHILKVTEYTNSEPKVLIPEWMTIKDKSRIPS